MESEDFLNKLKTFVAQEINLAAADFRGDIIRIKAEQSAQRFLLEQLYADAFKNNVDALENFEVAATSIKPKKLEPMNDEQVKEMTMLTNLSLERFFLSVRLRLQDPEE